MTPPCLILAAGFGTRMGTLTSDRPKPLLEVGGKALLDHAIDAAEGAPRIMVNAHYRAKQIEAHLEGTNAEVLIEAPDILDSGGAVKNALMQTGAGPISTINADAAWAGPAPLPVLVSAFDPKRMGGLVLLVPRDRAHGRQGGGDFAMSEEGRLTYDTSDDAWVYTGAQILSPDPILAEPRNVFGLRDIWADIIADGRLFGLVYPGHWADVGHPQGLRIAEDMMARYG